MDFLKWTQLHEDPGPGPHERVGDLGWMEVATLRPSEENFLLH